MRNLVKNFRTLKQLNMPLYLFLNNFFTPAGRPILCRLQSCSCTLHSGLRSSSYYSSVWVHACLGWDGAMHAASQRGDLTL
jgi:hypothetical protein